ncbi:hypothetical protein SDC9_155763 [bioreactor metagenome]|uniref:Phosphatidylglycerol lysyltransferase C-terminal domain-containing protein n=1 Tax=bioreactor metagenome TaxID=1076179 RepID=A0A645F2K0_9ZZZZ
MWRDYFKTEYAITGDTLFFKVKYLNGETAFSAPLCPCGRGCEKAAGFIFDYCAEKGIPAVICMAAEEDRDILENKFVISSVPEPNWSDYMYNASDLADMAGKRYSGQRNHIHAFMRDNPDYQFEEIGKRNIREISEFFLNYERRGDKTSLLYLTERAKVFEVFNNWDMYRQSGIVLRAGMQIVGFAIGEIIGDTLFVHIEKANAECRGAYQMLVKQFAVMAVEKGAVYINREDDAGDEGLRISKLSYHPCEMVNKYTVTLLEKK